MTALPPDPDEDADWFLRHLMETAGAPSLHCRNRACRRHRRCVGALVQDHLPCLHTRLYGASAPASRICAFAVTLLNIIQRREPAHDLALPDPIEREMAIRLVRLILPKRRWRHLHRYLVQIGARPQRQKHASLKSGSLNDHQPSTGI